MASSTLDDVQDGTRIFVDASVFIYHFSGVSAECRTLLERCERGEIKGVTSTLVMAEALHRLMMIEAVASGHVSPGNIAKKLRKKPQIVRKLHLYQEQVEKIPLMGIEIEPADLQLVLHAAPLRSRYGFLTNDSLIAATLGEQGLEAIASGDRDFARLAGVELFSPSDI
jgi:predicted nucleic acid-binding protein